MRGQVFARIAHEVGCAPTASWYRRATSLYVADNNNNNVGREKALQFR